MVKEEFLTSKKKYALRAKEFICKAGYLLEVKALHMVRDEHADNVLVDAKYIKHYFVLGEDVSSIKGKMTNRKSKWKTSVDADIYAAEGCNLVCQTSCTWTTIHFWSLSAHFLNLPWSLIYPT